MAEHNLRPLLERKMTRGEFLTFSGVAALTLFGALRIISELRSHAAVEPVGIEPEKGTLANGATATTNSAASGGSAVKFGSVPVGRDRLVYDTYWPSMLTAGHVTPRSQLKPWPHTDSTGAVNNVNSKYTIVNDANVTYEGYIIYGRIIKGPNSANVQWKDCLFRGPSTAPLPGAVGGQDGAIIICREKAATSGHWTFTDCTVEPQCPNPYDNAFIGYDFSALRVHSYWVNDHYGVYTPPGSTRPTNVEIAGCYMQSTVYWHSNYYVNDGSQYLNKSGSYQTNFDATNLVSRGDNQASNPSLYAIKQDGTHNDGIEVQGGYGSMIRSGNYWTGNGIYIHGNTIDVYDAEQTAPHIAGAGLVVPKLGTQDCNKRANQSPSVTASVSGWRLPSGKYAPNGQAIVVVQNVNQMPQGCLVIERNRFDNYGAGVNLQYKGNAQGNALYVTMLNNVWGSNVYEYSRGNARGSSTYPLRVYDTSDYAHTFLTPAKDGSPGLDTNIWEDARWRPAGSPLIPGRNTGIQFSPPLV